MKIYTNKKRILISLSVLIILFALIFINYTAFKSQKNFNYIALISSFLISIISSIILAIKVDFTEKTNKIFTIFSLVLSILFTYIIVELLNHNVLFSLYIKRLIFNFVVIILLHLFIFSISNKINITVITVNSLVFLLGLVNYTVICFRGTPLVPWDFLSLKVATYVASNYTFTFTYHILLAIPLYVFIISIALKATYCFKKEKTNYIIRVVLIIITIATLLFFYMSNMIDYFDFEHNLWKPLDEYRNNGFLASFLKQSKNLFYGIPEKYSKEIVEEIYEEVPKKEYIENTDKPNIIVIMNESYSDLTVNRRF